MTVFESGSTGNIAPTATISGGDTFLNGPRGIALDGKGNIYIANFNSSVTVYPAKSAGDALPSAIISGSNTGLTTPNSIALDSMGNIYVVNFMFGADGASSVGAVLVFAAGSNGNIAPTANITGPACTETSSNLTGLCLPSSVAVDSDRNIYVTNDAWTPPGRTPIGVDSVSVFPAGSTGNVAPSAVIAGSNTGLQDPGALTVDSSKNIYLASGDAESGIVETISENFQRAATGTSRPSPLSTDRLPPVRTQRTRFGRKRKHFCDHGARRSKYVRRR